MKYQFDIVTLFPEFFKTPLSESILKRAQDQGLLETNVHDLRDWTYDNHRTADDKPFGGGAGMVLKPEPMHRCLSEVAQDSWVVLMDPHGPSMNQAKAHDLLKHKKMTFVAGHYEGVDYRVKEHMVDEIISIGDFITMGGEAPILCILESVVRLIPGVLGNQESIEHESFESKLLEYPQYTRPRNFEGWEVPEVLMSGNHAEIEKWRKEKALEITKKIRPDLLA